MPPVAEKLRVFASEMADFVTARFLLKRGRSYEQAVKAFQPYRGIKKPNAEAREVLLQVLKPEWFAGTLAASVAIRFLYLLHSHLQVIWTDS